MLKKIIAILLCLCTVLPMAVSCKKDSEEEETTYESVSSADDNEIPDSVGDARFDGTTVTFALRGEDHYVAEFFTDTTDTKIDEAIFKREAAVEARLGVALEYMTYPFDMGGVQFNNGVRNSIMTGLPEFDIIANYAFYSTAMTIEGLYANIRSMPYITLENPWYSQSFVNEVTYNDKLYLFTGDMAMSSTEYIVGMFYNKDLAANKGINQNLYGVVANGEWTLPYFKELIKNIYDDVDGGGIEDPDDVYGLILGGGAPPIDQLLYGVGFQFTEKNKNGEIKIILKSDDNATAFTAIHDLYHKTDGVGFFKDYLYITDIVEYFKSQHGVFMISNLKTARDSFTDLSFKYGLLPIPKLDENQENYRSFTGDAYSNISVPHNAVNKEAIGAVIEVMSRVSYYDLRSVVFEEVYKYRYFDEPQMAEVFDTIVDSRVFDFGAIYTNPLGNTMFTIREAINEETNMFASVAATTQISMNVKIKNILAGLDKAPQ